MASGQQLAEKNFATFQAWLVSKSDMDFRQIVSRGVLSRQEISKECGFAKSALDQNPRIKALLRALGDGLRVRSVLPALHDEPVGEAEMPLIREVGKQRAMVNIERLKRLEQEKAGLHAENNELWMSSP
jgi:hypothetical protein